MNRCNHDFSRLPLAFVFFHEKLWLISVCALCFLLGLRLGVRLLQVGLQSFLSLVFRGIRHQDDKIVPACAKVKTGGMGCSDVL